MKSIAHPLAAAAVASMIYITALPALAQQEALSREEALTLLAERDAIIIELQHTVRALHERLDALEPGGSSMASAEPAETSPEPQSDAPPVLASSPQNQGNSTQLVIDEAAAERALERTLVQTGALLLPRGRMELVPTLSYGSSDTTFAVSALLDTRPVLGSTDLERSTSVLDLAARFGLPGNFQLEIGVPYLSVTEISELSTPGAAVVRSDATGRGTGDFRVGLAKTLMRESGWRPDLVGRLSWRSGEGDVSDGGIALGGGFETWSGSLSFVKRRDPLAVFWSLGYSASRERDGTEPGDQTSISFGTALAVSPGTSLFGSAIYRSAAETRIGQQALEGSDFAATSLNLGMTTILRRGTLLTVFTEVGVSDTAPDYSLGFSLPMRR